MKASTLRAIRAKLDMTLPQFGEAVGYGPQSISEMEHRKRVIPPVLALAVLALDAGISDPDPPDSVILE
jgi:transcriptional regulator with XRE-family HTH domain